jgi:glycerate-2-kinase
MIIKNFNHIANTPLRTQALQIAEQAYASVDPIGIVEQKIKFNKRTSELEVGGNKFTLKNYKKITCIGFGKAAYKTVAALQQKIGEYLTCGFVIDLVEGQLGNITCRVCTHPYPTEVNVNATKELLALLKDGTEDDLVIFVVSGGGSSLLCYPSDMTCETETRITQTLTKQGADIVELNTVRKHISKVKGGYLAQLSYPATVLSMIISDVPGNNLDIVASGPTVMDKTTVDDASAILKKYNILELCQMPSCSLIETPKDQKYFEKVYNILIASPFDLVQAMQVKAEELGWKVVVYDQAFTGDAQVVTRDILAKAQTKTCFIGAGETTVKVIGNGLEGRCQVMALASLDLIKENQVFLPLASDGFDHSDAAGAIVDSQTKRVARINHLIAQDYLANNDSYHFFEQTGDLVFTGKTGTNVSDFFILLTE